ncbi:MAG TPA: indole-3-glycerol phosphate synthase TrpC [Longimicrobiaceae bacterium]|nr:indole-3-glycerol phosphate synthase TrpC [Longimicrobiaceae bacterium]
MSILQRIVDTKRGEVAALAPRRAELRARAADAAPARGFAAALRRPGEVRLLAEVKRRSPSAGEIRPGADPVEVARAYEAGGAAAVSVLTDREYFGGDLDALRRVRAEVGLPALRKDFLVDPVQIWEARDAGADAVLLIARILDDALLAELLGLAAESAMDALVEVHDAEELERALAAGARLVGVNNRDLGSFRTDLELSVRLAPSVPGGATLVAESGIRTAADVDRLGAAGVDAVLVGESLMRQDDLRAAAAALAGRPRDPAARP